MNTLGFFISSFLPFFYLFLCTNYSTYSLATECTFPYLLPILNNNNNANNNNNNNHLSLTHIVKSNLNPTSSTYTSCCTQVRVH